ncbi:ubiquitin/ISG15-conjugating enzyme E2 L6 isoform X4 [Balaenoptera acutorostrata]|uniref:E2 ubiquitin-conjugating enzyme n=1 Tax=Balaenoptera acutorostrata TaxID=9767 RepID=A0A452C5K5_BALAC|nr:ubiquitin/ISG15-conjugating enzyme E2 L6 isoform X4 [Balaenoptera acutorostrata]
MTASKRVAKELEDLQKGLPRYLRNLFSDDADVLVWHALLLPEKPPYNLKAFNLRISFPEEYPFKPPTVTFTTRIYHPNVDSSGRVCLPIISKENWKPFTKTCQADWKEKYPGARVPSPTWYRQRLMVQLTPPRITAPQSVFQWP